MSQLSQALETEVAALDAVRRQDRALGPRERVQVDRHVARLLRLLAPRIRYLTRSYGLSDAEEDARQACAIGLMRAVEMYYPAKASFTTLVTWQLRGELQGLRHRLRLDQRGSARAVGACTPTPTHAPGVGGEGREGGGVTRGAGGREANGWPSPPALAAPPHAACTRSRAALCRTPPPPSAHATTAAAAAAAAACSLQRAQLGREQPPAPATRTSRCGPRVPGCWCAARGAPHWSARDACGGVSAASCVPSTLA